MTVTSRWVRYPIAGTTEISTALAGEHGYSRGTANTADSFTIGAANNQMQVQIDGGDTVELTLTEGTDLDPRFIAKDIQRKIQAYEAKGAAWEFATCEFTNYKSAAAGGSGIGQFMVKSGSVGGSSAVAITNGSNNVLPTLGLSSRSEVAGTTYHTETTTANNGAYTGSVTCSGSYGGMFDEEYYVVISNQVLIAITPDGGNTYAGTAAITGDWNQDADSSYVVTIDTTAGEVMNAGTTAVPTFIAEDSGVPNDDITQAQELLFSDTWYAVGDNGVRIKFTDAQFGSGDSFTIACTAAAGGGGAVSAATFVWHSSRGDNATSASTTQTTFSAVGKKGVQIAWSSSGTLTAKDAWRIVCRSPQPEAYGVTNINYGNVTVTSSSPVKVHQFEIMSGATTMSNVKFSLYSHGTFSHHDTGDADTEFGFGTVGAGNRADYSGVAETGVEWRSSVTSTDLATDKEGGNTGTPTYLWAVEDDLPVVATADSAEEVGNDGLVSDFIYTAIVLGANETGANSTIVYRLYFDFS